MHVITIITLSFFHPSYNYQAITTTTYPIHIFLLNYYYIHANKFTCFDLPILSSSFFSVSMNVTNKTSITTYTINLILFFPLFKKLFSLEKIHAMNMPTGIIMKYAAKGDFYSASSSSSTLVRTKHGSKFSFTNCNNDLPTYWIRCFSSLFLIC